MLVLGLIVLAALAFAVPTLISKYFGGKKAAEVDAGQAGAMGAAGSAAVNTVETTARNAQTIDNTVREGSGAIHAAPEADRGNAALRASCRLRSYRDTPKCKELAK